MAAKAETDSKLNDANGSRCAESQLTPYRELVYTYQYEGLQVHRTAPPTLSLERKEDGACPY